MLNVNFFTKSDLVAANVEAFKKFENFKIDETSEWFTILNDESSIKQLAETLTICATKCRSDYDLIALMLY